MRKKRKQRAPRAPRQAKIVKSKFAVMHGHKEWLVVRYNPNGTRTIIQGYRGHGAERNARTLCAYLRKHGEA